MPQYQTYSIFQQSVALLQVPLIPDKILHQFIWQQTGRCNAGWAIQGPSCNYGIYTKFVGCDNPFANRVGIPGGIYPGLIDRMHIDTPYTAIGVVPPLQWQLPGYKTSGILTLGIDTKAGFLEYYCVYNAEVHINLIYLDKTEVIPC